MAEKLTKALQDSSWEVRKAAAKSLGLIGDQRAIEPLSQSLQDADEQVRKKAVEALTGLKKIAVESSRDGHQQLLQNRSTNEAAPNVNRQTNNNLTALNSSNPNERAAAACALGKAGAVEAIPALINLLGDETPVQGGKCWGSGEWGPALHVFKQPSPGEQAALALASFGEKAVEPLIGALSGGRAGARRNAAWALGEIADPQSFDTLIAALKDQDPGVRKNVRVAISEIKDE